MNELKDKTPEQISEEDYKVAPTSADEEKLNKHRDNAEKKGNNKQ